MAHGILHKDFANFAKFHDIEPFDNTDTLEREANLFAAELILEDHIVFEKIHTENRSYIEVAQELYVPARLMEFKLVMLKQKGYILMDNLPTTKSDFLKADMKDFDNWY